MFSSSDRSCESKSRERLHLVEVLSTSSEIESVAGVTLESVAADTKPVVLEDTINKLDPNLEQQQGGGGEVDVDDLIQVSHLASIEVNQLPQKSLPRAGMRRKPSPLRTMETNSSNNVKSSSLLGHLKEEDDDDEDYEEKEDDTTKPEDDDVIHSDALTETIIVKSPYEADCNAEKGEAIFIEMKKILTEDQSYGPTGRAVEMFGPHNASCLTRAADLIQRSGMVYSQEWVHGKFRDIDLGKIPPDLLLLCLVPSRFVKAGDLLLAGICKDMNLFQFVNDAIDEWGLQQDFKLLRSAGKNYNFVSKKRDCLKCAIFVARLFCCFKHLQLSQLSDRLLRNAEACLSIMQNHISTTSSEKTTPAKASESNPPPAVAPPYALSDELPSWKKRRGRPAKSLVNTPESLKTPTVDSKKKRKVDHHHNNNNDNNKIKVNMEAKSLSRTRRATSEIGVASIGSSTLSMQRLISRFEEQYNEIGKKYQEMGRILQQVKEAAVGRERTEEEIRADLLEEVQKSILKSLPRK